MLSIILRRARRVVGMRVVEAKYVELAFAGILFAGAPVVRGNQKPAAVILAMRIGRGPSFPNLLTSGGLGAEQESTALVGIVARAVGMDLPQLRGWQRNDSHRPFSSQKCSLRYLSAL